MKAIVVFACLSFTLAAQANRRADVALRNWAAPLYWQPSAPEADASRMQPELSGPSPKAATPVGSLVFVAMTPCRVVDTRTGQGFTGAFGPPSVTSGAERDFPLQTSTVCTIPPNAQAYSLNVTIIPNPLGSSVGYVTIYPTAASPNTPPTVVTLDDITGDIRNNAAIVPAGISNGSVSVVTNGNSADLVIDINGYYAPATGITLAQGTASVPSLSFSGDATTGIYSPGTGLLNLATGGTTALMVGGPNTALGAGALSANTSGFDNEASGYQALQNNTTGGFNTASGYQALQSNSSGGGNTANGAQALQKNTSGLNNTAAAYNALANNVLGSNNTASGAGALFNSLSDDNTASGFGALNHNVTGSDNTAVGSRALNNNMAGSTNIAVGFTAGTQITGSNNVDIGNAGTAGDGTSDSSGVIRIGDSANQTSFFAAGIRGVTTNNNDAIEVMIDSNGQLGTVNSSRRFKEDIQDMGDASDGLLRLRPVTYRYQRPYADGSKPVDYGLIAEEVAKVYPDLVVRGMDGQVQTVQYNKLIPMLLNEAQKEHEGREQDREMIRRLEARIAELENAVKR